MAQQKQIFKCDVCGIIVEALHGGEGSLVCCGQDMVPFEEKTADQGKEKHVPVIEKTDGGITVKVGDTPHPMEDTHYIEWIEVIDGDKSCRHYLKPGQDPQAVFESLPPTVTAREYCNVHGLWKS